MHACLLFLLQVTDANKHLYIQLMCQRKIVGGIQQQLEAFLSGFHELIPPALISVFDDKELELLLSGLPTINLDDLRANTDYVNYQPNDQTILWFWEVCFPSLSRSFRSCLLHTAVLPALLSALLLLKFRR